jgi:SOS response regulatory protein OraA/RecX
VEEIRHRLLRKGFPTAEVESCLSWLRDRDLLDDRSFSRALVRDRLRFSPTSPAVLRRELARKGVSPRIANEAVEEVLREEGVSEADLAEAAGRRWAERQGPRALEALLSGTRSPDRERAHRRLHGFLGRRGFRGEARAAGVDAASDESRKILGIEG